MSDDMHGGLFDTIGDLNHDGKVDMQDYHLWQDECEESESGSDQQRIDREIHFSEASILLIKLLVGLQLFLWIAKWLS